MSGAASSETVAMRVRGIVQGVGFRPTVWRMARAFGLHGDVRNDAEGVLIRLCGPPAGLDGFRRALESAPPPLARIVSVEISQLPGPLAEGFVIVESARGDARTQVAPDARTCEACATEIANPANRRFGYALTNCTHCGPRLSILRGIPYDRVRTTMAPFPMCDACLAEYRDPEDRRFHAEPIACPACGPVATCVALDGAPGVGDIGFAAAILRRGGIIAIKGMGGYQLACDATNAASVSRLRVGKRCEGKPFALMAKSLDVIRNYCSLSADEEHALASSAGPIVLLRERSPKRLPEAIAPGLATLGFMLPTTPLHALLLKDFDCPVVMTSGNISNEPQIIDDAEACDRLAHVASHAVLHGRAIANRIDDSVVRFMAGRPRLLRRARGCAPASIMLPEGFAHAPAILAMGGEVKATFCLLRDGEAILSQHQGDLEHPSAYEDFQKNLGLYAALFDHAPLVVAADAHPEYLSAKLARSMPARLIEVQHHHAHIAACLCENLYPLDGAPVLGIALDGLGWGADGTFWGGEFLLANYRGFDRLATFRPVAMPGGAQAVREPWRNLYAQIATAMGWPVFHASFPRLAVAELLRTKPLATLDAMIARGLNAPLASSCGRLFDAVAAALGLCADRQAYEGEAASLLEALAACSAPDNGIYPFVLADAGGMQILEPAVMWQALFADLAAETPAGIVAARFHRGLTRAIATMAEALAKRARIRTIALSGGCFQNRLLFEGVLQRLQCAGFEVLTHSLVPANDGGISLGQAAIAAGRLIAEDERIAPCA